MNYFRQTKTIILLNISWKQKTTKAVTLNVKKNFNKYISRSFFSSKYFRNQDPVPKALRSIKQKAETDTERSVLDIKHIRAIGGKGGDGNISFLQLWANDCAGPDGGDGGHGGHVILQASINVRDFAHISTVLQAEDGGNGQNKDCFGKNAEHTIINVPVGTIIRTLTGKIIGDLNQDGMMFIAARGGAGGHGNSYFKSDVQQSPRISEYGAEGEEMQYVLEISSMAHVGLIGLPNAGKSTLLRAISRARPKVAAYPFTTLRPHLGMVLYDDYEQIAVADLPGLISDSHKNKGLGIQFLKHIERCKILLFVVDATSDEPWKDFETLKYEIEQFNTKLTKRSMLVAANKMDLPVATENLKLLEQKIDLPIIPISAKMGTNISTLLKKVRILYDKDNDQSEKSDAL